MVKLQKKLKVGYTKLRVFEFCEKDCKNDESSEILSEVFP
jgi:hypothetical protein